MRESSIIYSGFVLPAIAGGSSLLLVGLVTYSCLKRTGPVRLVSRGVDYVRASGFLLVSMSQAAWLRRDRWQECVSRARTER